MRRVSVNREGVVMRAESSAGAALGQGDADAFKRLDHFISRLRTEVLDLQQIFVAEAHQIGHGVDLGALEAVVSANRKVELLERDLGLSGRLGLQARLVDHRETGRGWNSAIS